MPGFSRAFLVGLALGTTALAGCATSGADVGLGLAEAPGLSSEQAFALPDSVSVLPLSASSDAAELAAAVPPTSRTPLALEEEQRVTAATSEAFPEAPPAPKAMRVAQAEPDLGEATVASLAEEKAEKPNLLEAAFSPATYGLEDTRGKVDRLIDKYDEFYDVPADLVRGVVKRESNFQPAAYNHGHWGLMQIKHATARGMGYRGPAKGLLDPETNLKYAVRYLAGAYLVADGNHKKADRLYQRGYYYGAKRKGLLDETGLGRDRVRRKS